MAVGSNGGAGKNVKITTSLPANAICTICGWSQWRSQTGDPTICAVDGSGVGYGVEFVSGTLEVTSSASGDTAFGSTPSSNTTFFWALTFGGTGVNIIGYWALPGATSLNTATHAANLNSFTPTQITVLADLGGDELDGIAQDVKIWTAVLSSTELLAEMKTFYAVRTTNLYAIWPLANNADTTDASGNAHTPTLSGALTTETALPSAPVPAGIILPQTAKDPSRNTLLRM